MIAVVRLEAMFPVAGGGGAPVSGQSCQWLKGWGLPFFTDLYPFRAHWTEVPRVGSYA